MERMGGGLAGGSMAWMSWSKGGRGGPWKLKPNMASTTTSKRSLRGGVVRLAVLFPVTGIRLPLRMARVAAHGAPEGLAQELLGAHKGDAEALALLDEAVVQVLVRAPRVAHRGLEIELPQVPRQHCGKRVVRDSHSTVPLLNPSPAFIARLATLWMATHPGRRLRCSRGRRRPAREDTPRPGNARPSPGHTTGPPAP